MFARRQLLKSMLFTACLLPFSAFAAENVDLGPGLSLLEPIVVDQLAVFPVVRVKKEAPKGDFLTLKKGLEEKLVAVTELEKGASVNNVRVQNKSDKPLLLLGGELILGGQQDRVMSSDTIIEPRQTQTVAVFCVEHGRWTGAGQFNQSGGFAEGKLRRLAKFDKDQGRVWGEVATKTGALKAESDTGTYRTLAAGDQGKKAKEKFNKVRTALAALPQAAEVVGVVSAVNGTIRSVDIFQTPELFGSYRDGLLDSLFIDAADAPVAKEPKAAPPASAVKKFIDDNEKATAEEVEKTKVSNTVQKKAPGTSSSTIKMGKDSVYRSYQNTTY